MLMGMDVSALRALHTTRRLDYFFKSDTLSASGMLDVSTTALALRAANPLC